MEWRITNLLGDVRSGHKTTVFRQDFDVPTSGYPIPNLQETILPGFLIDRHETTNADYQAFVDADGYSDSSYWSDLTFENA